MAALPKQAEPEDLISRCRAGDTAAFRELYQRHSKQVAAQLSYLVPRADLEDVLQDVFIQVFRSIDRFEGRSAFTTWLYRLAVHVAMKSRRRAGRSRLSLAEDGELPDHADPALGPREHAMTHDRMRRTEALIDKLSPKKRAVLVLHDLQGVDAARVAELVGTNILTVRTRLFYARREFEQLAAADPALAEFFQPDPEKKQ